MAAVVSVKPVEHEADRGPDDEYDFRRHAQVDEQQQTSDHRGRKTIHASGVRNGRGRSGCCLRRIKTPSETIAKASKVPEFDVSASFPTGNSAAQNETTTR